MNGGSSRGTGALNSVCIHSHCSCLLGTPLGGGMMHENTQLYREGNISQVTKQSSVRLGKGFITKEADGDSISSHVSNAILSSFVGELPESGQVHLYFLL